MNIQQDFKELLKLLEDNSVKYLIVGGYAVAFHGFPRLTKDIDFCKNLELLGGGKTTTHNGLLHLWIGGLRGRLSRAPWLSGRPPIQGARD
ncbi:MAG: hypothetical protein GF398_17020 [Chitinivibrionales bacterium]|nr:hypothetical protein [Chitinivibrionales bacterium]